MVWSFNTHFTADNYALVHKSRPDRVLHTKLYYKHNFGVITLLLHDNSSLYIIMELLSPSPPPKSHQSRATDLTRDDRIRVATLREEGYTYK